MRSRRLVTTRTTSEAGRTLDGRGRQHDAGKPRPVLVIQDDRFDATSSVTVCPLISDPAEIPLLRIALHPSDINGLAAPSSIMLDKVTTMPRSKLGERIGKVSDAECGPFAGPGGFPRPRVSAGSQRPRCNSRAVSIIE